MKHPSTSPVINTNVDIEPSGTEDIYSHPADSNSLLAKRSHRLMSMKKVPKVGITLIN